MDAAGSNRYELLFMDDEGVVPSTIEPAPKKKVQSSTKAALPKSVKTAKVPGQQVEKENKSSSLNKNVVAPVKKQQRPGPNQGNAGIDKTRANDQTAGNSGRSVNFQQNGNFRDRQNNRRNFENGEIGNDRRSPRQFRDRDNRIRDGFRAGKREFDRQSGSDKTGVKAVDKRDGAGAHNWGSVKQEIEDINTAIVDNEAEKDYNVEPTTEAAVTVEDDETKKMTLDEWKALREQREKPKYNIRKPGEGEDTTQWKKMTVLNKKKVSESDEELEYDPSMYPQRVGRLQRIVDIQFNFNDSRRGGGFGRGRGRGFRSTGNDTLKGDNSRNNFVKNSGRNRNFGDRQRAGFDAPKVDDERQFPTLS